MSTEQKQSMAEQIAAGKDSLFANYRPAPIILDHGQSATVYDSEGGRYIDMVAGVAVSALGHGHPKLVKALQDSAAHLLHTSNLYYNPPSLRLARLLCDATFADRVFFCQSGAEANEAALKLARRFHYDQGSDRFEFVTALQSFHGRTFGALSATGQEKYHKGFAPLVPGFTYVPYGDAADLEQALSDKTAAVMLEPIQGEGGVRIPPAGYLQKVRELCDERGILLIFDEVQTGMGRTGTVMAHEHDGVTPDIASLAKGLAGGLPLGAMLATERVAKVLVPGSHASTFGGNPVSCALAEVVVDEVTKDDFINRINVLGDKVQARLQQWCNKYPVCVEARGRGLLRGVELAHELPSFVDQARQRGVLTNVIGGRVIRVAPPLVITEAELDEGLQALEEALIAADTAIA